MICRNVATCASSGGCVSSSGIRAATQCSKLVSCSMTVGIALPFSSGSLQSRSSPALMLDARSNGQLASRHTRSSVQPSNCAAHATILRPAWPNKLIVSSTRPAP